LTYLINESYGLELARENFADIVGVFGGLEQHLCIRGVLFGSITGQVFVAKDRQTALLCNKSEFYIGGNPYNSLFIEEVSRLLRFQLLPELNKQGSLDYVLYYPSDEPWKEILEQALKDLLPIRSGRMTLTHTLEKIDASLPEGVSVVDSQMLTREDIHGMSEIVEEIESNWCSIEAFNSSGFGCVAIQEIEQGYTAIGWCLTDWVVGDECEIGIEINERFQRQGWGHKLAMGTLALAKVRGMMRVGWQCWGDNIGSIRTAQSVGFEIIADFPVFFGWNEPRNHLLVIGNMYMCGDAKYGIEKDYPRAAWSYAKALDQGWDWNGDSALYWNTACLFYLIGDTSRAIHYYEQALQKGWIKSQQPHYHKYVYRGEDSEIITEALTSLLSK
jgi:RimJ/RimL family protein N-acetyltransferase